MPDLETLTIAMLVILNATENKNFKPSKLSIKSYREEIMGSDTKGVNAMSISDITGIPRATVIRKLRTLEKKGFIRRNKKLEYTLGQAKNLKAFQTNYLINQKNFIKSYYKR